MIYLEIHFSTFIILTNRQKRVWNDENVTIINKSYEHKANNYLVKNPPLQSMRWNRRRLVDSHQLWWSWWRWNGGWGRVCVGGAHLDVGLLVEETLGCCREAEGHPLRRQTTHHTPLGAARLPDLLTWNELCGFKTSPAPSLCTAPPPPFAWMERKPSVSPVKSIWKAPQAPTHTLKNLWRLIHSVR